MPRPPLPEVPIPGARPVAGTPPTELLDTQYFHVVFTVPEEIAIIAYQNKRQVYDILFRAAAETLRTIAADPAHLGAEIGFFAVLHTWGQNLLHHPHLPRACSRIVLPAPRAVGPGYSRGTLSGENVHCAFWSSVRKTHFRVVTPTWSPFAALLGSDGRRLAERFDLRLLQTGRDLLRPAPDRLAAGLLALGGIDFDADARLVSKARWR